MGNGRANPKQPGQLRRAVLTKLEFLPQASGCEQLNAGVRCPVCQRCRARAEHDYCVLSCLAGSFAASKWLVLHANSTSMLIVLAFQPSRLPGQIWICSDVDGNGPLVITDQGVGGRAC